MRGPHEQSNRYKLAVEIVALSVADTWDEAKLEWALEDVFYSDEPGVCLCGHRPILEQCIIVNQHNGNEAIIGNVCVKRFLGLPSDKLFAAINRIAKDPSRALNTETVEYAHRKGWMNDWERKFYMDTLRKRGLSPKQRAKREQINQQVLYWVNRK